MYVEHALAELNAGSNMNRTLPVRVQTLWLADDFALIGLQGEPLIGLGAAVERAVGPAQALVLGYANGCVTYLPDSTELSRGGYEQWSFLYHNCTGPFTPDIEDVLADAVWKRQL